MTTLVALTDTDTLVAFSEAQLWFNRITRGDDTRVTRGGATRASHRKLSSADPLLFALSEGDTLTAVIDE